MIKANDNVNIDNQMEIDYTKYPMPARFRHHTSPYMYLPLDELKNVPEYYPPCYKIIKWDKHFQNGLAPKMLDIGCGRGFFLLNMSLMNPESNILGIEVRKGVSEWVESIIVGEKIGNCSILWYTVANGLMFINDNSIEKAFYLFPDPWPKKKHHKRRAFNESFLNEISRVLAPTGRLYLASDVEEVHEYHLETLKSFPEFDLMIVESDDEWGLTVTNKEKFCRLKNIPYYRLICTKR